MDSLQKGAEQAIKVCMGLKEKEVITIVTDRSTLEVGDLFKKAAEKITDKKNINILVLEDYGKRPMQNIPEEIKKNLEKSNVVLLAVSKVKDESIRRKIRLFCFNKIRYAHMPGITKKVLETGLATDQKKVWEVSKKVFEILDSVKKIKVTSSLGTNFTALFDPKKMKWVNSDSNFISLPQTGSNLPGAEVFTCPTKVNGTAIIDGELGDFFTEKYGQLEKSPLKIEIKDSRVINLSCKNKELWREFKQYIKQDENSNRIGEFAFGTNVFIKGLIGVLLQDEKFPTVHIAVGNPYPERTNADWGSKVHCDGVIKNVTVIADGKKIMEGGKYLIL